MPFGTSTWQGRIAFPSSQPADYSAVGPVLAGDWGANNVNHYSDIMGQRRACWSGVSYELDSATTDQWVPLWSSGEFPIALNADGSSYGVRIHVAGASGGTVADVRFAVVLSSEATSRSVIYPGTAGDYTDAVWFSDTYTSGTPAWLTGAGQGPNAWARMVSLSADEASRYMRGTVTLSDISDSPASVSQCMVTLSIYAQHKDAAAPAQLHGFIADEWPL